MQLGMVGLGRIGSNLVRCLMPGGHESFVSDVNADTVKELEGEGATGICSLEALLAALEKSRAVWVMVPAGRITEETVSERAHAVGIQCVGVCSHRFNVKQLHEAGADYAVASLEEALPQ